MLVIGVIIVINGSIVDNLLVSRSTSLNLLVLWLRSIGASPIQKPRSQESFSCSVNALSCYKGVPEA